MGDEAAWEAVTLGAIRDGQMGPFRTCFFFFSLSTLTYYVFVRMGKWIPGPMQIPCASSSTNVGLHLPYEHIHLYIFIYPSKATKASII